MSSAFVEAQANDPDYAEWVASQPESPASGPRLSEWTPERAELVNIGDRLAELIATTVAVAGGKWRQPKPAPRPRTAIDKARERQSQIRYDALVDEVMEAQRRWEESHRVGPESGA